MPMAEVLRTQTVSETRGLMKMLIAKDSDEILGFAAFGFEASEQMPAVQTAMIGRMPYTMLRDDTFTHPTMSEGLNEILAAVPPLTMRRG
jgi:pyruvate/2-oxoglutarate dehydrogenase complex dihydrolipoamide dehydrogenase (E3) component